MQNQPTNQPNQLKHNSNYRPDIDGLRAIACLAVVFYHAFPGHLPGGFVGVDIFFVISGFLISSILFRNLFDPLNPGKVNIVDYYIRRIRRIFPALIVVLIFCILVGNLFYYPDEYKLLMKHVFGGSTYISNLLYYKETGDYFNVASNQKPLLHLWSLGVEEQFYIVFPIFLWLVYKCKISVIFCLVTFTVISFCANLYDVLDGVATRAFYMPWTRFWELSIGSVLAYTVNYKTEFVQSIKDKFICLSIVRRCIKADGQELHQDDKDKVEKTLSNTLSILGVLLILAGYLLIKSDSGKFPGVLAVVPVLGALLIIATGQKSLFNRYILSSKPFVFFGLISYPLYLWHWSLISNGWILYSSKPSIAYRIIAIIISIVLAIITYYFVEPRLRYGKHSKLKALSLLGVLSLLAVYGASDYKYSFTQKLNPLIQISNTTSIEERQNVYGFRNDKCLAKYPGWKVHDIGCFIEDDKDLKTTKVALFGDSHSGHLVQGLVELKREFMVNAYGISVTIPFIDFESAIKGCPKNTQEWRSSGARMLNKAMRDSAKDESIKLVVLTCTPGGSFNNITDLRNPNETDTAKLWEIGARRTINFFREQGKKVLFVLDNPILPFEPSACTPRNFASFGKRCDFERSVYDDNLAAKTYNSIIKRVAKDYSNVFVYDLSEIFCDDKLCYLSKDGHVLYRDNGHLNIFGSRFVAPYLEKELEAILRK